MCSKPWPSGPPGSTTLRIRSVAAIAKTPSLNASSRFVVTAQPAVVPAREPLVLRNDVERRSEALGEARQVEAFDERHTVPYREAIVDGAAATRVERGGCEFAGRRRARPSYELGSQVREH